MVHADFPQPSFEKLKGSKHDRYCHLPNQGRLNIQNVVSDRWLAIGIVALGQLFSNLLLISS
jgi:hypothetical protein